MRRYLLDDERFAAHLSTLPLAQSVSVVDNPAAAALVGEIDTAGCALRSGPTGPRSVFPRICADGSLPASHDRDEHGLPDGQRAHARRWTDAEWRSRSRQVASAAGDNRHAGLRSV